MRNSQYILARAFRDNPAMLRQLGFPVEASHQTPAQSPPVAASAAASPEVDTQRHPPRPRQPAALKRQKRSPIYHWNRAYLEKFARDVVAMAKGPIRPPGYWLEKQTGWRRGRDPGF